MMTPGDFPSLQEGMENLDTDDYVGWRLPSVTPESVVELLGGGGAAADALHSEEEDPEEYGFPLTLRQPPKAGTEANAPNGSTTA